MNIYLYMDIYISLYILTYMDIYRYVHTKAYFHIHVCMCVWLHTISLYIYIYILLQTYVQIRFGREIHMMRSKIIIKCFQFEMCCLVLIGNVSDHATEKEYFDLLFRGGLTFSSWAGFAIIDYAVKSIIIESAERFLEIYSPKYIFICD